MSGECWFFNLEMTTYASGNKDFSLQVISAKYEDCSEAKIVNNNSAWRPKIKKNRVLSATID